MLRSAYCEMHSLRAAVSRWLDQDQPAHRAAGRGTAIAHYQPSSARTSLTMPQNDTTQIALRKYGMPSAYTGT